MERANPTCQQGKEHSSEAANFAKARRAYEGECRPGEAARAARGLRAAVSYTHPEPTRLALI
eukprot:11136792-Alexandrium_andersonii.AAC.1